jgi:hypothetical protein
VFSLHVAPRAAQRLDVLCIGAHCDDIEIGCGGTLLALQRHYPRLRVHRLVPRRTRGAAAKASCQGGLHRSVGARRICMHDLPTATCRPISSK